MVTILLALYQGETYLPAQLSSLLRLTGPDWRLLVSDDGSDDRGPEITRRFAARAGREVRMIDGPGRGHAANFMHLLGEAAPGPIAFCDQDDVWFPDKLDRAMGALSSLGDRPGMYCGRSCVTAANLLPTHLSRLPRLPPSFGNALVQSLAGGNTIVVNSAGADLLRRCLPRTPPAAHDWWAYQVMTSCGGSVLYDPKPALAYRQHSSNAVGDNRAMGARLRRGLALLTGRFRVDMEAQIAALTTARPWMTADARAQMDRFLTGRAGGATGFWRSGAHRQGVGGTVALGVAAALGRI
jgi:glycosyltransferase involved in cell wall biosynthesis